MAIDDGVDTYLAVIIGLIGQNAQGLVVDIQHDGIALSEDTNQVFLVQTLVDRGTRTLL